MPETGEDATSTPPRADPVPEAPSVEHQHRDVQGGAARAAVFGVSDGLVSNASLILGVAGADPAPGIVRLAGLAGLIAGAVSMAAGEYVSMRAQTELLERELELERVELHRNPHVETVELAQIYASRGLDPDAARHLAEAMMVSPELALQTHAREELGVDPDSLGSPMAAAISSFIAFAVGAILPLIPWFFAKSDESTGGPVVASVVLAAAGAIAVGIALSRFTGKSWWWSAGRQLLIAVVAAGVTYGVGSALGVGVT